MVTKISLKKRELNKHRKSNHLFDLLIDSRWFRWFANVTTSIDDYIALLSHFRTRQCIGELQHHSSQLRFCKLKPSNNRTIYNNFIFSITRWRSTNGDNCLYGDRIRQANVASKTIHQQFIRCQSLLSHSPQSRSFKLPAVSSTRWR